MMVMTPSSIQRNITLQINRLPTFCQTHSKKFQVNNLQLEQLFWQIMMPGVEMILILMMIFSISQRMETMMIKSYSQLSQIKIAIFLFPLLKDLILCRLD